MKLKFDLKFCRKGDYYRYLAEFKTEQERKEASEQSLKGYEVLSKYVIFLKA